MLGLLDDIILLPVGIWLVRAAIPEAVLADARSRATGMLARGERPPVNWVAGAVVLAIWVVTAGWAATALWGWLENRKAGGGGVSVGGGGA